jgi:hypothetical protein
MIKVLARLSPLLIISLLFANNTQASHYLGGDLTWRCYDGTNPAFAGRYIFTLKLYRDCRGADFSRIIGSSTETINFSGGTSFNLTLRSIRDLTPDCTALGAVDSIKDCRPVNNNDPKRGAVEQFMYDNSTNPVTLPSIPPASGGWTFSNTNFARPPTVNLTNQGAQIIRARMYAYTPAGSTSPLPASPCYDNSPRFLSSPNTVICSDYRFTYNYVASDKEVDSLYYDWAAPLQGLPQTSVTWATGFSQTAPYPDQGENPANGSITLDGTTGQLTVEAYNPSPGNYVSCVRVEAWQNCQLKAEIFRDLATVFNTSSSCAVNNPPVTQVDLTTAPSIQQIGGNYYVSVYPGDTVKFDLLSADSDLNGSQFQNISFEAASDEIGNPFNSQTACVSDKTPCATFTPIAPQMGYTNPIQNEVSFLWVPGCDHLSVERGCEGLASTYPFILRMVDDGCPVSHISNTTVIVDVLRGDPRTPLFQGVNILDTLGNIELNWSKPPLDSGLFFNYYVVYADSGNGNFGPIDTIVDSAQLSTTFGPNKVPNGITIPNSYYIVMSMRSRAGCEFFSLPSDTMMTISSGIGLEETSQDFEPFTFYPNPSKGTLHISANVLNQAVVGELLVYDLRGKRVLSKNVYINTNESIELPLPREKGVYFYIISGENLRYSQKVVVQ